MSALQQVMAGNSAGVVTGQQAYTTAGTYSWVCPAGVTSVSVVCVGGAGSGPGAGLGYKNNYAVTPGNSYSVVVGAGNSSTGNDSHFVSTALVKGGANGTHVGDGGGDGGTGIGGGAGGYSGNGGACGSDSGGSAGAGGGGGGGGMESGTPYYSLGGGVGILGQGSNGAGGVGTNGNGSGGSGGSGTTYGGGGGYNGTVNTTGGGGAVRIIWPGNLRSFPSTRTANE